jgi:hypothetical protein
VLTLEEPTPAELVREETVQETPQEVPSLKEPAPMEPVREEMELEEPAPVKLVREEMAQETLQEVSVLEEQVPAEPVRDESGTVVIHDVSAHAETVAVNAPLGGDDAHSEVVEPRPGGTVDGEASAPLTPGDICLDLVEHSVGPNLFGGPASGEAVQAFESLSVVDPRVTELGLSGYPG